MHRFFYDFQKYCFAKVAPLEKLKKTFNLLYFHARVSVYKHFQLVSPQTENVGLISPKKFFFRALKLNVGEDDRSLAVMVFLPWA